MRIGKKPQKSKSWVQAGAYVKPKHISPDVVIGQLSPDIVSTVYASKMRDIANDVLLRYADEVLLYEDAVKEMNQRREMGKKLKASEEEVEIDMEGNLIEEGEDSDNVDKIDPSLFVKHPEQPLFHSKYVIDEMDEVFSETSKYFFSKEGGWKTQANMAKFERIMDEKYGIFRPFIKQHPQIEEAIRSLQRRYATGYFSPFRQKDPPIPKATAIIVLFMMQRGKVRWEIMLLTGTFLLVGLQPWALIVIVAALQMLLSRRKNAAVGKMKTRIPAVESYYNDCSTKEEKYAKLLQPVGTPAASALEDMSSGTEFDTIIVGCGTSSLYTGALLARAGRKVLLLAPGEDASGCITMEPHKNLPEKYNGILFDIQHNNISKFSQQIQFLAPALSTQSDLQGGVRFCQVGSAADNHAFEILEIPGMGPNGSSYTTVLTAGNIKEQLMDEAATFLGDGWPNADGTVGNSAVGAFISACEQINASSNLFYTSKIIPDTVNNARSKSMYGECAIRYTAGMLNQSFPLNNLTRSLVAAIGMRAENIRPKNTSLAASVTHLCAATSGEGMYYPVGGPRALCHAFANVIERNGGRVVIGAPVKEFLFEDKPSGEANTASLDGGERIQGGEEKDDTTQGKEDTTPCPRCIGVKLVDDRFIKFAEIEDKSDPLCPAVVSMTGLVDTFIRLLPDDIRTKHKVPRGLPALSESRPTMNALFLFNGTAADLEVSGADYYRLPNAAKAYDELDKQTGQIKYGDIGWSDEADSSGESAGEKAEENLDEAINNAEESKISDSTGKSKRNRGGVRFETGYSWISISFPSAKDPSFEERHGKVTICVVTFEADDDFVKCFETKPKLYVPKSSIQQKSSTERLLQKVKRDLFSLYPQLEDKMIHAEIPGVILRSLMHNPERFVAKGVRADTPYPGLFVGGHDLTVSGSFSAGIVGGWLVANAVAGYNYLDLMFLQKHITSDISQFLEVPVENDDDDDVAVPFTPIPVEEEASDEKKTEEKPVAEEPVVGSNG